MRSRYAPGARDAVVLPIAQDVGRGPTAKALEPMRGEQVSVHRSESDVRPLVPTETGRQNQPSDGTDNRRKRGQHGEPFSGGCPPVNGTLSLGDLRLIITRPHA